LTRDLSQNLRSRHITHQRCDWSVQAPQLTPNHALRSAADAAAAAHAICLDPDPVDRCCCVGRAPPRRASGAATMRSSPGCTFCERQPPPHRAAYPADGSLPDGIGAEAKQPARGCLSALAAGRRRGGGKSSHGSQAEATCEGGKDGCREAVTVEPKQKRGRRSQRPQEGVHERQRLQLGQQRGRCVSRVVRFRSLGGVGLGCAVGGGRQKACDSSSMRGLTRGVVGSSRAHLYACVRMQAPGSWP
jgi:hypothetical protein